MITHVLLATVLSAPPPPEVWDPPNSAMAAPKAPAHAAVPTKWYGVTPLVVDALALGAGFALMATDESGPIPLPMLAYLLTAPINHFARGHAARGAGSLVARNAVAGIGALALVYARVSECGILRLDDRPCAYDGFAGGAALFAALAAVAVVDDLGIAREEVPPPRAGLSVVPMVQVAGNQTGLGLGGRF